MMASLFSLWFLVTVAAWTGFRRTSITLFVITLLLACIVFNHHLTSSINIQL